MNEFLQLCTKSVGKYEEKQGENKDDYYDDHVQVSQGVLVLARKGVGGAPPSLDDHDDGRDEKEDTPDQYGKVEGFFPAVSCPSPSRPEGRLEGWP